MSSYAPMYLLTGCTACGKTSAALDWAERFGAEIVSCDSLLFYRGMDIGTAKPTVAERARVRHHLIDFLDVTERIDVRRYCERARGVIDDIVARRRRVLVTGGSGFYLRSFFSPVADDTGVDDAVRADLEHSLAVDGLGALVRRLEQLNPRGLFGLDTGNPRRVVRALERCLVSGRTLEESQAAFRAKTPPFAGWDVQLVEVAREAGDMRTRILARVQSMLVGGLVDEVIALRARGLEQNPSAARAIGYRETLDWLSSGRTDHGPLAAEIATHTWQLVRKQRTWFRTQLPPHRVVTLAPGAEADAGSLFEIEAAR